MEVTKQHIRNFLIGDGALSSILILNFQFLKINLTEFYILSV